MPNSCTTSHSNGLFWEGSHCLKSLVICDSRFESQIAIAVKSLNLEDLVFQGLSVRIRILHENFTPKRAWKRNISRKFHPAGGCCWQSVEAATKVTQKWLKSDFRRPPQSNPRSNPKSNFLTRKVTQKWLFRVRKLLFGLLWGGPRKSLFSQFWATLNFSGFWGVLGGTHFHNFSRNYYRINSFRARSLYL